MPEHDLVTLGREAARDLKAVLPLVRGDHKEENARLFEQVAALSPELEDQKWGSLAFIAGLYSGFMGRQGMSPDQRSALWNAVVWAVQYESRVRPKMLRQRARQMVGFVKDGAGDQGFVQGVAATLPTIIPLLDRKTLEFARTELRVLNIADLDSVIGQAIEQLPVEIPEPQTQPQAVGAASSPAAGTLHQLWHYLDRRHEAQNRKELEQLRADANSQHGNAAVARLGGPILRSMVQRYLRGSDVPDQEIELILALEPEIVRHSTGDFKTRAAANAVILRALRDTRRGRFEAQAFSDGLPGSMRDDREAWNVLASLISMALSQVSPGEQSKDTAIEWAKTLKARLEMLEDARKNEFYVQAKRHAPESLMLEAFKTDGKGGSKSQEPKETDWLAALLSAYRLLDLKAISRILKESRAHLTSDLCRKLATSDRGFDTILQPRRAIRMPGPKRPDGRPSDAFQEAKRLLESQREDDRRRACDLFEQYADRKIHPDYKPLAREWMLYARAQYRGLPTVFAEWQKDLRSNAASWEEVWNLTVFNIKLEDFAAALDALRPGVESLKAPYSHLRFALYCALQMLDLAVGLKPESVAMAQRFLIDNIRLHPLPECYLAWLLLVDEAGITVPPQDRVGVLGTFQQLHERPLLMLDPDGEHSESEIEAFRKQLNDLRLDKTWLIWINEYAERNPWRPIGFQKLTEALEGAKKELPGALDRAAEACQRMVELQKRSYEQKKEKYGESDPRYLRGSLIGLFNFYKRNLLEDERVRAYKRYSRESPYKLCFDVLDPANNALVNLTRDLIESSGGTGGGGGGGGSAGGGSGSGVTDAYILENLKRVDSIKALQAMQERIITWIDTRIKGSNVVQQRASSVKDLVLDICRLESKVRTQGALQQETKRLNTELERASAHISAMKELRPLQSVLEATQAAYANFIKSTTLQPVLRISAVPPGISVDAPETSLVLDCENLGPGDVGNIRITCSDDGTVTCREKTVIPVLVEGQRTTVAVPVMIAAGRVAGGSIGCRIQITYDCGVLKDLPAGQDITTTFFDFLALLDRARPGVYEIPIPYTEEPIDFSRNDARLFQGRDLELEQVRSILNGQLKTDPIYYHGVRKVGKSSLLGRISLELAKADVLPLMIKLEGIRAAHQELPLIVNTFTAKIIDAVRASGVAESGLQAVSVHESNPIMAMFNFLRSLSEGLGGRRVALLIDEFQNLVAPVSTPLLDILRQLYQERRLLLFFSGWYRPKKLEKEAPDSQLFPLVYRGIDFLSQDAVGRVLREPLADLEIRVPDSAVEAAFALTAGNPHHLAALAIGALNRLNAERRVCITTQDLEFAADGIVINDRYFRTTIFSQTILLPEEREAAIRFAQVQKGRKSIPVSEATQLLAAELLDDLREKGILQRYADDQIGVRGVLLAASRKILMCLKREARIGWRRLRLHHPDWRRFRSDASLVPVHGRRGAHAWRLQFRHLLDDARVARLVLREPDRALRVRSFLLGWGPTATVSTRLNRAERLTRAQMAR